MDDTKTAIQLPKITIQELFVASAVVTKKLGLSSHTLQSLRKDGSLIQGIHFTEINSRLLLYNLPLLIDWLVNKDDPHAHTRAIENFQAGLLSNQSKSRSRQKILAKSPHS